jgi:hypothetical protein
MAASPATIIEIYRGFLQSVRANAENVPLLINQRYFPKTFKLTGTSHPKI